MFNNLHLKLQNLAESNSKLQLNHLRNGRLLEI